MIPGIPTSKMPIDTFNQQMNELFANMKAHQQQKIQREQLMQAVKNHADEMKFKQSAEDRAGALAPLKQKLLEAQTQHQKNLDNPELMEKKLQYKNQSAPLQGPARDAADLERLKKEVGENSSVYMNALASYNAQTDAKKDLRDLRERTKQGLRPGEKQFFDEKTGEPLGKEIPLTEKERESEQGNILFSELYPYVYKGASPFSGEGSIIKLEQAASNYKTNAQAKKMIDDFLLADKMLAASTVNEASTLKAGKTNRTYMMLKDSLEAQDIPKLIKKLVKQYNLPPSAQFNASMRYQKLLSDARKKASSSTPATQKLFYNPEMQQKHEEEKLGGSSKKVDGQYNDNDKVKVEGPNGIEVMTYAEAKKLGAM